MEPQLSGRPSRPAGRADFTRLWVAGVWLLGALMLAAVGVAARSTWRFVTPLEAALALAALLALRGATPRGLAVGVRPASLPAAAALVAAVAFAVSLGGLPSVLRSGYDALEAPALPLGQADIDPLGAYGSVAALSAAARVIPPGATYTVVYGDQYPIPLLFQYWLGPTRTFSYGVRGSTWVVLYGEPAPPGLDVRRRVELAPGIQALEVAP